MSQLAGYCPSRGPLRHPAVGHTSYPVLVLVPCLCFSVGMILVRQEPVAPIGPAVDIVIFSNITNLARSTRSLR